MRICLSVYARHNNTTNCVMPTDGHCANNSYVLQRCPKGPLVPFKVSLPKVTSGREKGPSTVDPKIHYVIAPSSSFSVAPRARPCCPSPRPRQSVHLRSVSGGNRVDLGLRALTSRGGAESGRPRRLQTRV